MSNLTTSKKENIALAVGVFHSPPTGLIKNHNYPLFTGDITIYRPEGSKKESDVIPYQVHAALLREDMLGKPYYCTGEFRSRNEKVNGTLSVQLYFHIENILPVPDTILTENKVCLNGYICKEPYFKSVKNGTIKMADAILAVHRKDGFSDYIPCVFYGSLSYFAKGLSVGSRVTLTGHMTERIYPYQGAMRTAYELQVHEARLLPQ